MKFEIESIGFARTPFPEKFTIPRQSSLLNELKSEIHIDSPHHHREAFLGLKEISHIWIFSYFHLSQSKNLSVKPPRLGGNKKQGLFATRSPARINSIGLSLAKLHDIEFQKNKTILKTSGLDLVDQTPIIDIKPYVEYSDRAFDPNMGWIDQHEFASLKDIHFSVDFLARLGSLDQEKAKQLIETIEIVFREDPRPAYLRTSEREYKSRLLNYDLTWKIIESILELIDFRLVE